MTSEAPSPSASFPSETPQPGAIVASETDSTDFRGDAKRRAFLRVWREPRGRGPVRRVR